MKTFIIGVTQPDWSGLRAYLEYTKQDEFMRELEAWRNERPGDPLCLVSFYAKLCYKSLVEGKNANVTKIRGMEDNLKAVISSGHGSVFEHVSVNFVTTACSRVFTHELVRHRAGTAFSQTSGRYVSIDEINIVLPPELSDPNYGDAVCWDCKATSPEVAACQTCNGYGSIQAMQEQHRLMMADILPAMRKMLVREGMSFDQKKRITSAIRRYAPNGQENEIGWSCNVRALRHMIEMRTSPHAEWEIRKIFEDVAAQVQERWPLMLNRPGVHSKTWEGLRI